MIQDIDLETGEILLSTALVTIPQPGDLQRYENDKALIALTEQVLELGKRNLESVQSIEELRDARAKVQAIDKYITETMHDRMAKIQASNNLAELVLRQQRAIGALLKAMPKNKGERGRFTGNTNPVLPVTAPTLSNLNITPNQSSRWQKQAAIPEEVFDDITSTVKENVWKLGDSDLIPSNTKDYDGDEWYTPSEFLEAARELMGEIDCDPASCDLAQRVVKASTYFTVAQDGLDQDWHGRVWLNPPYSLSKVEMFTRHLIEQYDAGITREAILLVNNCTEVGWFIALARRFPVMFSEGRAKFWQADQKTFATRQGQAIFYLGNQADRFFECFGNLAYAPNQSGE